MLHFELKPYGRPYREALTQWERDMEQMFDGLSSSLWHVPCEISETDEVFTVRLDIPGVRKEDVSIELKDRQLHVTGKREKRQLAEGEKWIRQENRFGQFQRSFALPQGIDESRVRAQFVDGVLSIELPKSATLGRRIEIA
jgi:HSP20 family protein